MLGGRALTSIFINNTVDPLCDPLGAENKLIIAPGLLTGTPAPCSGRLSVGAKSPLTSGIKESNVGGLAGQKLARLGIKALVIEGAPLRSRPETQEGSLWVLKIDKTGAELMERTDLSGLGNYKTVEKLRTEFGEKVGIMSIGTGGEQMLRASTIAVVDAEGHPSRHAGRGGLGAVMGSKGIKAIVIDDDGARGVALRNREKFMKYTKALAKVILKEPYSQALNRYGTAEMVLVINELGGFTSKNFMQGTFDEAENISGERLRELLYERNGKTGVACHPGCIVKCSNIFVDAHGEYVTSALEYETIWATGSNCGIDDLDTIAQIDRLCDDFGVDTIDIGVGIGIAMTAGILEFGDGEGAIELVKEIERGTARGRALGNGAAAVGKKYKISRTPVVKGQAISGYAPRTLKGMGVTYSTSPMGADHTTGFTWDPSAKRYNPLSPKGKARHSCNLQILIAFFDCTGLCLLTARALQHNIRGMSAVMKMLSAQYGVRAGIADVPRLGYQVWSAEREFNRRAGFGTQDDRLPDFFYEEPLPPHNEVFDVDPQEIQRALTKKGALVAFSNFVTALGRGSRLNFI
jgi:aldehyde:ferredoxin oxidoreductase